MNENRLSVFVSMMNYDEAGTFETFASVAVLDGSGKKR
jgi:hypothetical protein